MIPVGPEQYQQISTFFVPGEDDIKDDDIPSIKLNTKINNWVFHMKTHFNNFQYRITNTEHVALPNPSWSVGTAKVMVTVNIAYTI